MGRAAGARPTDKETCLRPCRVMAPALAGMSSTKAQGGDAAIVVLQLAP